MKRQKGVYGRIFSYAFRYPGLFAGSVFFSLFVFFISGLWKDLSNKPSSISYSLFFFNSLLSYFVHIFSHFFFFFLTSKKVVVLYGS